MGKKVKEKFDNIFEYYTERKKEEISLYCNDNGQIIRSSFKNLGYKLFIVLLSSVIFYTGLYQIIIPLIIDNVTMELWQGIVILLILSTLFIIIFIFTYIKRNFNVMRWLIYILLYALISFFSNMLVTLILSLYEFGVYEIYVRFLVGLIFSLGLVMISFIITRRIICRVDIIEL